MAAPTAVERGTPGGIPLKRGYQTLIGFTNDLDVEFWEKTVQPPGIEGGDPIPIHTMHNTRKTKYPQKLVEGTPARTTVAWDPICYTNVLALINVNQAITFTLPDTSTITIWGWLRSFTPQGIDADGQPEAEIVIEESDWDDSNNVEAAPAIDEKSGT